MSAGKPEEYAEVFVTTAIQSRRLASKSQLVVYPVDNSTSRVPGQLLWSRLSEILRVVAIKRVFVEYSAPRSPGEEYVPEYCTNTPHMIFLGKSESSYSEA